MPAPPIDSAEQFRIGNDRMWCHAWHAGDRTVVLSPAIGGQVLQPSSIRQVVDVLHLRGVQRVLTAALDARSSAPFVSAGFSRPDLLRVFVHHLDDLDGPIAHRVARGRARRDRHLAAHLDGRAFRAAEPLDEAGLDSTLGATPTARMNVVRAPDRRTLLGYSVCGLSANTGYLQRLAVDPDHHRRGVGTALVRDALRWLERRNAERAFVNASADNVAACTLYARIGFVETPEPITVWCHDRSQH